MPSCPLIKETYVPFFSLFFFFLNSYQCFISAMTYQTHQQQSIFSTTTCPPASVTGWMYMKIVIISPPHIDTCVQMLCIKSKPYRAVAYSVCAHISCSSFLCSCNKIYAYGICKISLFRIHIMKYINVSSNGLSVTLPLFSVQN